MAYRVVTADLAAVIDKASPKKLVDRDVRIVEVSIIKFSGSINLHFGPDADPIAIDAPISFKPTGSEQRNGLWFSNDAAQAGVTCKLVVSSSGGLDPDIRG